MVDLEFPEKEVDLVDIDEMVYTNLPQYFPKRFMSVATPVFMFRCFNKITRKDRDEAKEEQKRTHYYSSKDTIRSERADYNADKTKFKNITDEKGQNLVVNAAGFYRNGHQIDQMIRKSGNLIYIIFDKHGRCGRLPFSEKNPQYPFDNEMKQVSRFADDHNIFDGDYGLL